MAYGNQLDSLPSFVSGWAVATREQQRKKKGFSQSRRPRGMAHCLCLATVHGQLGPALQFSVGVKGPWSIGKGSIAQEGGEEGPLLSFSSFVHLGCCAAEVLFLFWSLLLSLFPLFLLQLFLNSALYLSTSVLCLLSAHSPLKSLVVSNTVPPHLTTLGTPTRTIKGPLAPSPQHCWHSSCSRHPSVLNPSFLTLAATNPTTASLHRSVRHTPKLTSVPYRLSTLPNLSIPPAYPVRPPLFPPP